VAGTQCTDTMPRMMHVLGRYHFMTEVVSQSASEHRRDSRLKYDKIVMNILESETDYKLF